MLSKVYVTGDSIEEVVGDAANAAFIIKTFCDMNIPEGYVVFREEGGVKRPTGILTMTEGTPY